MTEIASQQAPTTSVPVQAYDAAVVVTLTPQQARALADAVVDGDVGEPWLSELATSLSSSATKVEAIRTGGSRRPLRVGGSHAPGMLRRPQAASEMPVPAGPAAVGAALVAPPAAAAVATTEPTASGSGLAAAVAAFAEALSVTTREGDHSTNERRAARHERSTSLERAKQLQRILDAAAATSGELVDDL